MLDTLLYKFQAKSAIFPGNDESAIERTVTRTS